MADLQIWLICRLKCSLSSISTPSDLAESMNCIFCVSINICLIVLSCLFINNQLSNLLTFTIILLALKQSVMFRDSLSETLILKLFPNIDPLGICWVMFLKLLFVLLTQTPCFRFFTNKKLRVVYQF